MEFVLRVPYIQRRISCLVSKQYMKCMWNNFCIYTTIVSNRDIRFLSHFCDHLKILHISLDMSMAYHPQTDNQTKVTNRALGNMLWCLVGENILLWEARMCQAEFYHNYMTNRSSRFELFSVYFLVIHLTKHMFMIHGICMDDLIASPSSHHTTPRFKKNVTIDPSTEPSWFHRRPTKRNPTGERSKNIKQRNQSLLIWCRRWVRVTRIGSDLTNLKVDD